MHEHTQDQSQRASTLQETKKGVNLLQRRYINQLEPTALQECLLDTAFGTFAEPRFGYDFSRVPAHTDMMRRAQPLLRTGTMVQRYSVNGNAESAPCATCSGEESTPISASAEQAAEPASPAPEATPMPTSTEPEEESAAPEETTAPALLVEDSAAELAPGQMRKGEFLAQLRAEVTRAAESAMAGTGRTTADCPYLDYWFDYYSAQDVQHGERALRRYAPEASIATTAREYIPIIASRVRRSVETWVRTGEVTGMPEGLPGMGLLGSIGSLISGIGSIFFKARNGGARKPNDPRAVQARLGQGRLLESSVRSRMESAFSRDFSQVRTHTDTTAAGLSNRLNARAFTVGEHVAFGSGEYRPGTLFGDALIAHEMAHVVQQSGASDSVAPMQTGEAGYNTLENDADKSAIGAMVSLWSKTKGVFSNIAQNSIPSLKSGLRLQSCKEDGCVTGHLTAKTSGALQGGWSVHDYLGGATWGNVIGPTTAGRDRTGFKVQIVGPYSGKENLGVSQTFEFKAANNTLLNGAATYMGHPVNNNTVYNEPVLDANDHFASRSWFLRYKDGMASFADVPRMLVGSKGNVDFTTYFYSKGTHCVVKKSGVVWRWILDLTPGHNVNNVTQQSQELEAEPPASVSMEKIK